MSAPGVTTTTPPANLVLPAIVPLPPETVTRPLALIEKMGMGYDANGDPVEGPVEALLGTVGPDAIDATIAPGVWTERKWMEPVTENPLVGATEVSLPPFGTNQLNDVVNRVGGPASLSEGQVTVEVSSGEGRVIAVLSVVDQVTGDPTTLALEAR